MPRVLSFVLFFKTCTIALKRDSMLEAITEQNQAPFKQLIQAYEHEFAPITGKKPQADGLYALDSDWRGPNEGYYYLKEGMIVGFCIIGLEDGFWDVREFYIVPKERGEGMGTRFACEVFALHRGPWQVRQIEGANQARLFWRKAIQAYTGGEFQEEQVEDAYWGKVTRQQFEF